MSTDPAATLEDDALLPQNHPSVHLPVFQGPMDLLLFLIRKNEIDIYDIPIQKVTSEYMEALRNMEAMDLELTGEFFVMAATLMVIKSRMLLPKQERAEEEEDIIEEDPRWELVQQLLEYKKLKEATVELQAMITRKQDLLPRDVDLKAMPKKARPVKNSDRLELWGAFNQILHRLADRLVEGEIYDEQVSMADRMTFILEKIRVSPKFYFTSLIPNKTNVATLVATFLALLELCRMDRLILEQSENFGDILCTRKEENVVIGLEL